MRGPVLGAIVFGVLGVLVISQACVLPTTDAPDGASCAEEKECKSHRCVQGFCGGSSCKLSDASSCDSGWKCVHSDADPITAFFGNTGSDSCRALCGSCPANMFCDKATAAKQGSLCQLGKAPLDITIPEVKATVGQAVHIVAVVDAPSGPVSDCKWSVNDGTRSEVKAGTEIDHAFTNGGSASVGVTCTDPSGRTGTAEGQVTVVCQAFGGACDPALCCASENGAASTYGANLVRCFAGASPTGHVCRAPLDPKVTIAGPTSVPIATEAQYTASITGDAELDRVEWHFTDDSFGSGSKPVAKHTFRKVGAFTVAATATDKFGRSGQANLAVIACQSKAGFCTDSAECCAGSTCQPVTSGKQCL